MPEGTVPDPTDKGTLRPNAPPLPASGEAFKPMILPDFAREIRLPEDTSPNDPITLFTMYYSPKIIDWIVEKTNAYTRVTKSEFSRAGNWYPTCPEEIYIYLAIRIYMTLHIENEISDYWSIKELSPRHPISQKMARDRFQELHMRVRLAGNEASGPYQRVSI